MNETWSFLFSLHFARLFFTNVFILWKLLNFAKNSENLSFKFKFELIGHFSAWVLQHGELNLDPTTMKFNLYQDSLVFILLRFKVHYLLFFFIFFPGISVQTFDNFKFCVGLISRFSRNFKHAQIYRLKVVRHKIIIGGFSNFVRSQHVDFWGKVFWACVTIGNEVRLSLCI